MTATAMRLGAACGLWLILLGCPLAAEDSPPHHQPALLGPATADALPPEFSFHSGSNKVSLVAQHIAAFQLSHGASVTYENIKILADGIDTTQSLFPGTKFTVLDQARLSPGPQGPSADTVSLDTRASQLTRVGFRGLLTPASALISRQPIDPAHPLQARYLIVMSHLGNFSGLMRRGPIWWPFEGWADRAQITFVADVTGRGLTVPRMEEMILFGSPDPHARPTEVKRMALPAAGAVGAASRISAAELKADKVTYLFGPDGQLQDISSEGNPDLVGDLVPSDKDAAPVPVPPADKEIAK